MPEPELSWDIPEWNDASLTTAVEEPGAVVWRLVEAKIAPDTMANTVWINVYDEQGQRVNTRVMVRNADGKVEVLPYKPDEPYNRPMWKQDRLAVWVEPGDSDEVSDIHGAYWNVPGVNTYHVGYILTFQKWTVPDEPEEPEPPPIPDDPTEDDIRNAAWNRAYPLGGIALNHEAALQAYARANGMGCPVTDEFDAGPYRVQGYALGIIYCEVGDWNNIVVIEW